MTRNIQAVLVGSVLLASGWFAASHTFGQQKTNGDTVAPQSEEFPDWLKTGFGISAFTAGPGIVVWYLWYTECKVKPRMEKIRSQELAEMVARYEQRAKEVAESHSKHYEMLNDNQREDLQTISKTVREDMANVNKAMQDAVAAIHRLAETVMQRECKYSPHTGSSNATRQNR